MFVHCERRCSEVSRSRFRGEAVVPTDVLASVALDEKEV
jgi:hypothetical protein